MTSKLTRLTDDELTETLRQATSGYPLPASVEGNLRHAFAELQERRKADSEPVALQPELAKVIYHFRDWNEGFPVERFKADYVISWMLANYPPAQPAPVVPEKATVGEMPFLGTSEGAYVRGWNDCRAAMLQSRCSIQPAPALDFEPKTAEARGGNSPVIPDGYVMVPKEPTAEMIWAAKYVMSSTVGWGSFKGAYIAMLAAAPQEVQGEHRIRDEMDMGARITSHRFKV